MLQLFAVYVSATLNCKKGISALEYAVLAGVLVGVIYTAVNALGTDLTALFGAVDTKLTTATTAAGG